MEKSFHKVRKLLDKPWPMRLYTEKNEASFIFLSAGKTNLSGCSRRGGRAGVKKNFSDSNQLV